MMFALEDVELKEADSSATLRNENQENKQRQLRTSFGTLLDDIQEKVTARADFFSALRERVEEAMR